MLIIKEESEFLGVSIKTMRRWESEELYRIVVNYKDILIRTALEA